MSDYTKDIWFWKRLKAFVENVEVSDYAGLEEQQMILYACSEKLNEGIVNEANREFCLHCGTKINSGTFCSIMCRKLYAETNKI